MATDAYRLAIRDLSEISSDGFGHDAIIPARALQELGRLLRDYEGDVGLGLSQDQATFTVGDISIVTSLIEGKFPDALSLIPSSWSEHVAVGRSALLSAVKRVKILADNSDATLRLDLKDDEIVIRAKSDDLGEARDVVEGASHTGPDRTIALNARFLSDALSALPGITAQIDLDEGEFKPVLVHDPDEPRLRYVIMSVRVR